VAIGEGDENRLFGKTPTSRRHSFVMGQRCHVAWLISG
jgi:hypothetical protein